MIDCTTSDLPGWQGLDEIYPGGPAFGCTDTSREAAEAIAPQVGRLQALVLDAIQAAGLLGRTTNEVAADLNCPRDSVQPRTSELKARELISDSGQRRTNANGKRAIVWVASEFLDAAIGEKS